jgi:alpha-1,2-mannosyltransferase
MGARREGVASIPQSRRRGKGLSNILLDLHIPSTTAFAIFAVVNLLAATYAPIQDCDEVFNYWEPTHYLNHGFGFETWEYSPEYAIRSWLYIVIHALPGKLGSFFLSTRRFEFYLTRGILGCVCACCETCLFSTISQSISPRVAMNFLVIMATASGMFHASVAFLPSSFAMYTTMMGMAAFMDTEGGLKTNKGIMWFGLGATVGWPFAAVLVMPFLLQELVFAKMTGKVSGMANRIFVGGVRTMIVVVCTPLDNAGSLLIDPALPDSR